MSNQDKISLTFNNEEETTSLFLIEDLIKEYNNHVLASPPFMKLYPLSLKPIEITSSNPIIRPMTKEEIEAMHMEELHAEDWHRLKQILKDQITPTGVLGNIPNVAAGVTILEMISILGLKGEVYHKTLGNKTYVILKGYAKDRNILNGTRYLNTHPEIVRFGLAKVTKTDLFKQGFKSSLWVYGSIKAVEATQLCLQEDGLDPSFFAKFGADIPKLAITSLVTAAVGGAVVAASLPVAVGAGIVLVVGIGTGIALEILDQKLGFSEKLTEAANTMWKNLQKLWGSSNAPAQPTLSMNSNLLDGLIFGGPLLRHQQMFQKGDLYVYTA